MLQVRTTRNFEAWLVGLRDERARQGLEVVILLAGGDKSSQSQDIRTALSLARNL